MLPEMQSSLQRESLPAQSSCSEELKNLFRVYSRMHEDFRNNCASINLQLESLSTDNCGDQLQDM